MNRWDILLTFRYTANQYDTDSSNENEHFSIIPNFKSYKQSMMLLSNEMKWNDIIRTLQYQLNLSEITDTKNNGR